MRWLIRYTTLLVLVLTLGLHWALLQSVAWMGMIASYAREGSLSEAVSKTFDGKHPCCMCKVIRSARDQQKQQSSKQVLKPDTKLDLSLSSQPAHFSDAAAKPPIPFPDPQVQSRSDEPPKPRPRAV